MPDSKKPWALLSYLLVLIALINGTFLTGCAGLRLQHPARFQPSTFNQRADLLWSAVVAIPSDSTLDVYLDSGDSIYGRFRSADEQTLILVQGGNTRSVPRAEIRRVLLHRGNHAKKGALWGLAIGAATFVIDGARRGGEGYDLTVPVGYLMVGSIFGGIGAGAGALIGLAFPNRAVIYEAPVSGATN